jgi:hypothetical protein
MIQARETVEDQIKKQKIFKHQGTFYPLNISEILKPTNIIMAVKSAPIEQQILLFEGRIEIMDIYTSIFHD